jgi:2-polyprenyl-3-methyl-5-hydroxy-6-metoxy-1,4-benzoquinol methylase
MIKEQNVDKVENLYDTVAKEYAETFSKEHEKKPKDQEILRRFSQAIGNRMPVWDFGCGPGQTTKYLKDLGIEVSGLDLSDHIGEKTIHLDKFLGKQVDIDFMFFPIDFIFSHPKDIGFEKIETIEREPYPEVEYESRRAYVFAIKPIVPKSP